ncbi:MAG TPA: LysM peptidoglycan-binding domain-containing protein [Candidatus Merdisoma merdipullorum]|nr:LysM peptidoglycan-binding domain-containing protein [Candidatus Merdisoma merdipullorum]
MIEFVYKENAKNTGPELKLDLPKNVRQIGEPEENRKIYIEDYVVTYLKRFAKEEALSSRMAILLGSSERMGGIPYLFIKSAVALKELEYSEGGIPFTDEVWAQVYSTIKEYFPMQDILGWFLSVPGYPMELDPGLAKIHVNYFGGVDKVLLVAEPTDGDEDFFAYENGRLTRQKGYYIFYTRNEEMQRYMIDTGDGESIDEQEHFEDRAIKSFRTIVQEKKEISGQKRVMTFLYTASTFLVMVVLVIGITLINNYEKMEGLEVTLSNISRTLESREDTEIAYAENAAVQEEAEAEEAVSPDTAEQPQEEGEQAEQTPTETAELSQPEQVEEEQTGQAQADTVEQPQPEQPEQPEQTQPEAEQPQAEEAQETQEAASQSAVPETYVVQQGDTLLKISRKIYGGDDQIDAICSLNGIDDSDHILVGQKLLLP